MLPASPSRSRILVRPTSLFLASFFKSRTDQTVASIKAAAAIAANGLMKLYVNNATGTTPIKVGTFDKPIYWWEAGAVWGGLVDYWSYTGDASYVSTTTQALLAQKGPANDFMNVEWEKELVSELPGYEFIMN